MLDKKEEIQDDFARRNEEANLLILGSLYFIYLIVIMRKPIVPDIYCSAL
jgi:hypothetical protein